MIPCAIDQVPSYRTLKRKLSTLTRYLQDPYFRLTRDCAKKLKYSKPSLIHSKFFPALQGPSSKMSASIANSAVFLTDTPAQIKNKIKRFAFSGGRATMEEHRERGGDTEADVPYQWLRFFMADEKELEDLGAKYRGGHLTSSEMKDKCAQVVSDIVLGVQEVPT